MKDKDLQLLLTKSEELKALFVLGQRVIPFLEELFVFVKEISPVLDDINHSIQENLKRMPKASKQLSKVTEATETATTEIMDIVDGLSYKTGVLDANLKELQTVYSAVQKANAEALALVRASIHGGTLNATTLETILQEGASTPLQTDFFENSFGVLRSVNTDAGSIMMSLQVQDITSQQIAAVNHVIEAVQDKLGTILSRFQSSDLVSLANPSMLSEEKDVPNVSTMHRSIAFDPDAVDTLLADKHERQASVDDVISSLAQAQDTSINADDIDALFAAQSSNVVPEPETQKQEAQQHSSAGIAQADDFDEVSQDDIDALFK